MEYRAGNYITQLILNDDPYRDLELLKEITHYITVHPDGKIYESKYFSALSGEWTILTQAREWGNHVLNKYHLLMVSE